MIVESVCYFCWVRECLVFVDQCVWGFSWVFFVWDDGFQYFCLLLWVVFCFFDFLCECFFLFLFDHFVEFVSVDLVFLYVFWCGVSYSDFV